jgi:hypothetical protein
MCSEISLLYALFILCIILLILSCNNKNKDNKKDPMEDGGVSTECTDYNTCNVNAPIYTANGYSPLYRGNTGLGNPAGFSYPTSGCDMARLHTGNSAGSLGSVNEPTTLTFPEVLGYFGTGVSTAYTPNVMSAARSRDGLIHAGWVNSSQPGELLTNTDRKPVGYEYQIGSSIAVKK